MRKICVSILSIICATTAFADVCKLGESESLCNPGFSYKVCEIGRQSRACNTPDMLPSNAKTAECTKSGRTGYKICTAVECNNGYTPKGGRCVKNSSSSQTQTTTANNIHLTCAFPGDVRCQLNNSSAAPIQKIQFCNILKGITKPAGKGKAYLVPHSVLNECDAQTLQTLCPGKRQIEFVGDDMDLLIWCSDETQVNITYDTKNYRACMPQSSSSASGALQVSDTQYAICGNTNTNNCAVNDLVKGKDDKIYKCESGGTWTEFTNLSSCDEYGYILTRPYKAYPTDTPNTAIIIPNANNNIYDGYIWRKSSSNTDPQRSLALSIKTCHLDNVSDYCTKHTDSGHKYKEVCNIKAKESTSDTLTTTPDETVLDLTECENSGGTPDSQGTICTCDTENKYLETTTETYNDKTYSICKCIAGYRRKKGSYTDECVDANETEPKEVLDTEAMRQQAEDAYQAARDHEQSWANKGLTAATTLATGEGAMAATQAYFEQRADADAERDMAAYLATFKCEYGGGKTFNAGNEEIFLPGGNELLNYYSEYKTLADSVKQTKTALGLRSGIESEILYDRAQSGLYQYANAEQTSGGEISLSRALQNPEGIDAEKWNAQKAQTAQNLKTGITAVAGGVAGGIVGNYLINKDWKPSPLIAKLKPVITRIANEHPQTFKPVVEDPTPDPKQPTPQQFTTIHRELQNGTFISGSLELTETTKSDLNVLVTAIKELLLQPEHRNAELKIYVDAYTDGQSLGQDTKKRLNVNNNDELSQARANAILKQLQGSFNDSTIKYEATGHGVHQNCLDKKGKPVDEANDACRQLSITVKDEHVYTNDQ